MSTLREALQAIRDERGDLTPALVVEAARNAESPLHNREWDWDDDAEAARKWRLEYAGQLIRSVRIKYTDHTGPTDLRAFVAIKGRETLRASYVPTEQAMLDPLARALVLRDMEREWRTFKRRYEHMAEFAALLRGELAS